MKLTQDEYAEINELQAADLARIGIYTPVTAALPFESAQRVRTLIEAMVQAINAAAMPLNGHEMLATITSIVRSLLTSYCENFPPAVAQKVILLVVEQIIIMGTVEAKRLERAMEGGNADPA